MACYLRIFVRRWLETLKHNPYVRYSDVLARVLAVQLDSCTSSSPYRKVKEEMTELLKFIEGELYA